MSRSSTSPTRRKTRMWLPSFWIRAWYLFLKLSFLLIHGDWWWCSGLSLRTQDRILTLPRFFISVTLSMDFELFPHIFVPEQLAWFCIDPSFFPLSQKQVAHYKHCLSYHSVLSVCTKNIVLTNATICCCIVEFFTSRKPELCGVSEGKQYYFSTASLKWLKCFVVVDGCRQKSIPKGDLRAI